MKKLFTLLLTTTMVLSACGPKEPEISNTNTTTPQEKILREPLKNLRAEDVFQADLSQANISFEKIGNTQAKNKTTVTPEIAGKITDIKVKLGDQVKKDTQLAKVGDSINTQLNSIQANSAQKNLEIAKQSEDLLYQSLDESFRSAELAIQAAEFAYQNSLNSKRNNINNFDDQIESGEIGFESAQNAYKNARNSYEDALDALEQAENSGDNEAIAKAEAQKNAAKSARDQSKLALEQAEIAIAQIENGYNSQLDQLDFGVESSYIQYQNALNQLESIRNSIEQQKTSLEAQINQANSAYQTALAYQKLSEVKAPISGTITSISVNIGDNVGPGTPLIEIEDTGTTIVQTSLNENEAKLVQNLDEVELTYQDQTFTGFVSYKSPSLNQNTKKFDLEITPEKTAKIPSGTMLKINFKNSNLDKKFIPLNSITLLDNQKYVRTINERNKVLFVPVTTGEIVDKYIEIKDGIEGNEKIIVATTSFIKEGDFVKIANNSASND